jgi:hypothetical protein
MARTKGAQHIKGWREHGLLRDLALNEESVEALAEKYDIQPQTVYDFRYRNKHRIAAILADWSDQFSDQWASRKHARTADILYLADSFQARMDEMIEDAATASEVMRRVDPDAVPVRVDKREWKSMAQAKLKALHQYAEELGQLPQHVGPLVHELSAMYVQRFVGLHPSAEVKEQAKYLHLDPQRKSLKDILDQLAGDDELAAQVAEELCKDWYPEPVAAPEVSDEDRSVSGLLRDISGIG